MEASFSVFRVWGLGLRVWGLMETLHPSLKLCRGSCRAHHRNPFLRSYWKLVSFRLLRIIPQRRFGLGGFIGFGVVGFREMELCIPNYVPKF